MQVVVFNIGSEKYALDTNLVYGIEKVMDITNVPKAPSYVKGLANLRGTIISVIDLKEYLNVKSEANEESVIVIDINEERVGLLVDTVDEVVEIKEDMIEKAGETNKNIKGIINFKDDIVTLIDGESLLK